MNSQNLIKRHPLIAYFVFAYGFTWILSIIYTQKNFPALVTGLSGVVLHYGPALAAILIAGYIGGRAAVGKLLSGLRAWRVGLGWYLFVLLFPLATLLIAVGVDVLLGGTAPTFFSAQGISANGNPIVMLVPVFIAVLFQAGLAEEIGWRGFALPRLQGRYNALTSSLILGVLWAIWHYHPMNWELIGPVIPWHFIAVMGVTVIMTWVYNNTNGSLLLAVLFHTASNASDWIVPVGLTGGAAGISRASFILIMLRLLTAILLVVIFGAERLSRNQQPVPGVSLQQGI